MKKIIDLGKIGITLAGEYNDKAVYEKLTIVLRNGKSYISKTENKGVLPETDTAQKNWQLVAEAKDAYHMLVDAGKITLTEEEFLEQLVDATKGRYIVQGNIINEADEEDLTVAHSDLLGIDTLKLANRDNTNGMGYIILRKNKSFAEQVTKENTIYEIRYDFDLNGEEISIPAHCVLKFEGGSLNNGIINGNNTETVNSNIKCTLTGSFIERNFIYIKNIGENIDYTEKINNILSSYKYSNIIFDNAIYGINGSYINDRIGIHIKNNNQYFFNGCTFKQLNNNSRRSSIIYIENVQNLSIGNFKIIGDADSHISTGSTDEWNAGIELGGNIKNIIIHDVDISSMTGDCIEIALYNDKSNISIIKCKLSNAVRNCISIENGEYITIESCEFVKSIDNAVAPNCFIDIEPLEEFGGKPVKNVIIKNNYFNNVKQEHQCISLIGIFENSVSDINIQNNTFVGNIPLIGVITVLGEYCSNVSCSNNVIKITSLEYPYNEDLKSIILVDKATASFNNNIIEGKQVGTLGFKIFNGSNVIINNCTLNNVSIFASRANNVESISNIKLYDCKIENNNNVRVFYSSYTQNINIEKCYIKGKGTLIHGLDAIYNISDSNLFSENSKVFDDSDNVLPFNKSNIKCRIKNSVLESGSTTESVLIEKIGSIIVENTKIIGEGVNLQVTKTNEECSASFENCYIYGLHSSNFLLSIDGYNTCTINNSVIITTGKSFLYGNSDSIIFSSSAFLGLYEKNGIFYSENFNAVDFISCTLNGIPIIGRSTQSEYIEDYKPIAYIGSVQLYGGYRWNVNNKKPMWWNGQTWIDANGVKFELNRKGNSDSRPTLTSNDAGFQYYDTTLNKPIYWTGTKWVDATGVDA